MPQTYIRTRPTIGSGAPASRRGIGGPVSRKESTLRSLPASVRFRIDGLLIDGLWRRQGGCHGVPAVSMRIVVRVRPGSSRAAVGGSHDGALIVRVAARAVDGQANEAAVRALADAFGVRRRDVVLVSGATNRTKVIEVTGATEQVLEALLAQ